MPQIISPTPISVVFSQYPPGKWQDNNFPSRNTHRAPRKHFPIVALLFVLSLIQVQNQNFIEILMKITNLTLKFTNLYHFHLRFVIPLLEDASSNPTHPRNVYG
jgi:hypothetical protein